MKRILVCSDIHGEIHKFQDVLNDANYNEKSDQLILLGDYVDRGKYSKEVIEFIIELVEEGAIALKGNHEELFIHSFYNEEYKDIWYRNGGKKTLDSYNGDLNLIERHICWLEDNLQLYYETDDYIFVHAGLEPDVPLEWQDEETILWSRNEEIIGLGKLIVHGHTPVDCVKQIGDRLLIDTGAAYGGKLSLIELPSMIIYES